MQKKNEPNKVIADFLVISFDSRASKVKRLEHKKLCVNWSPSFYNKNLSKSQQKVFLPIRFEQKVAIYKPLK